MIRRPAGALRPAPSIPAEPAPSSSRGSAQPDPRPGRRRACLSLLLPALALLLGALSLFAAAPTQAQLTVDPDPASPVWSATLTLGFSGARIGYCAIPDFTGGGGTRACGHGSVSDDQFTLGGTTYAVLSIRGDGSTYTHLTLDREFPTAQLSTLTLRIGSVSCMLSDAEVRTVANGEVPNNYRWEDELCPAPWYDENDEFVSTAAVKIHPLLWREHPGP